MEKGKFESECVICRQQGQVGSKTLLQQILHFLTGLLANNGDKLVVAVVLLFKRTC